MKTLELKKSELEMSLLQISAVNPETGMLISGLLVENIKLGTKRKLQKIHKKILEHYKEMVEDFKTISEECGDDKEKRQKEIEELVNESVKIEIDPIDISEIENISSSTNYNFDIIEKFST